jgi:hypothetical protein
MVALILSLLGSLRSALRTRADLALENLAPRQQLINLRRTSSRARLSNCDRAFWLVLSRFWSRWADVLVIVTTLVIRNEADKNRFGRELPLSEAARDALDSVCPKSGSIFGRHDCIMLLRRAAQTAGIDDYRATRISDYDFRHSAATHLGRSSNNLPGVMYLLGHKQPATTACYMRPQKDAAAEVLNAAAVCRTGQNSGQAMRRAAQRWPGGSSTKHE